MYVVDAKIRDMRVIVRFRDDNDVPKLSPRSYCLVETEGDKELAKIKSEPYLWEEELPPEEEIYYVSEAGPDDFEVVKQNREIEREAFQFGLDRIREREMDMALAAVERTYDCKKLRFYFTAEQRIDFRDLVKDLAAQFRTRIEMRQIGVRDRAKKIGGFGICGQELCCSRFLRKFEPITIRMAKEQNLALNPSKISGLCGRLMCCLSYENEDYVSARREFPKPGLRVSTPFGEGTTSTLNYVKNTINVQLDEARMMPFRLDEIEILAAKKK